MILTPKKLADMMENSGRVDEAAKATVARYALAYCTLASARVPGYERLGNAGAEELYGCMGGLHGTMDSEMQVMVGQFGFGFPRDAHENPRVLHALKVIVNETPLPPTL